MNSLRVCVVLLALLLGFAFTGPRAPAQSENPVGDGTNASSAAASKAEVEQLRKELEAQRKTIEKLEVLVEQLTNAKAPAPAPSADAHLVNATLPLSSAVPQPLSSPVPDAAAPAEAAAAVPAEPLEVSTQKKDSNGPPVTAGWNGEHFYIKSADGQFQIQPYGYVQTDYRSYSGDGAPADTFGVRRARFGFQGNYGDHYQFGLLIDATATSGSVLRDVYLNAKYNNALQLQAGQFKEPFAQEEVTGITNIDFLERGLQAVLYPSAASAYRSPGVTLHGDIDHGVFQYWAGAFNGKGYATNNTTSVPETVGRVRFYPWRNQKDSLLHDFAFGGSISYGQARGLSHEVSPSGSINDAAYSWFPQFPVNGNIWRYEGEFTFIHGPMALRDEYVAANFNRTGVGTEQLGGLGFANLPNIRYQGWNSSFTYLLTKERRPENGTPRVRHPVFGPTTEGTDGRGWGAWEIALRYSGIQGNEPGIFFNNVFTPQLVPTFNMHTDQFTVGVNWYLNYWVRFQSNVDIDRLKDPSTIGAVPQNYLVFQQRLQFRF